MAKGKRDGLMDISIVPKGYLRALNFYKEYGKQNLLNVNKYILGGAYLKHVWDSTAFFALETRAEFPHDTVEVGPGQFVFEQSMCT